jgi:hypothetical protein
MAPLRPVLHRLSCSNETVRNSLKYEFWAQWSGSGSLVIKIPTQLRLANMGVNGASAASFASTFGK